MTNDFTSSFGWNKAAQTLRKTYKSQFIFIQLSINYMLHIMTPTVLNNLSTHHEDESEKLTHEQIQN